MKDIIKQVLLIIYVFLWFNIGVVLSFIIQPIMYLIVNPIIYIITKKIFWAVDTIELIMIPILWIIDKLGMKKK